MLKRSVGVCDVIARALLVRDFAKEAYWLEGLSRLIVKQSAE